MPIVMLVMLLPALVLLSARAVLGGPATGAAPATVLIDSAYPDGYELDDADEAVALRNVSGEPLDVSNWTLSDGSTAVALPTGTVLPPGEVVWLAHDAAAFARQFGRAPQVVLPAWPGFANSGDEVILASSGVPVDVLVYGTGNTTQSGWTGPSLSAYTVSGVLAAEGQVLFRRRDPFSGLPVADTNARADWGQMPDDPTNGRRVRFPGWRSDEFNAPVVVDSVKSITLAVAPDNAFRAMIDVIQSAKETLRVAALTLENAALGDALAAAAGRGVEVTVLLEGAPPGGLTDQERYLCGQIEAAGGACWFMASNEAARIHARYRFMHAKYLIADGRFAVVSSENISPDSMPDDDKADGTWGRRGVVAVMDEPAAAAYLDRLFAADLDHAFADLVRWQATDPVFGEPPPGFIPSRETGGITYTVRYPTPARFDDVEALTFVQSPDNSLHPDALLGLLGQAGEGDTLLVQQLSERPHWGAAGSDAATDPNPRLSALLAAARRGATVRLMLDRYFDQPASAVSNAATCAATNATAAAEGLRLSCVLANPTGLGIHNKMVLARIGGSGYVHVGSLNGTELSHKANRELSIQFRSDDAYAYLAELFERDWPRALYLPLAMNGYRAPATHLLITEVDYNPPGLDDAEYIELYNPTAAPVDLSKYRIGDATVPEDFEDMRHFPPGLVIAPGQVLVLATSATAFQLAHGRPPDLEVLNTDPAVPDLIDDPAWGDVAAFLQLGNLGDEVYLRGDGGVTVDMVSYGNSPHGTAPCGLVAPPNRVLERFPAALDTDRCADDFRPWPFPNPGFTP
jgi:phosphatidylserine/phosphatidylglycerophosphate/cardiolipin synthase-like enzyme